jgi:hypothetical protein
MKKAKKHSTTPAANRGWNTPVTTGTKPARHTQYGSGYTITEDFLM